jgi:hypothetical protein
MGCAAIKKPPQRGFFVPEGMPDYNSALWTAQSFALRFV